MRTFISLGAGPIRHQNSETFEWIHVDVSPQYSPDYQIDARTDLVSTFGVETVSVIASIHMLEHLPWCEGVQACLDQCFQVLERGGILRIVVPDPKLICRAYVDGSDLSFMFGKDFKESWKYKDCPAERLWHWFHAWDHTMAMDFQLLKSLLTDAGFRDIREAGFNDSRIDCYHYDRFPTESICVECVKP